MPRRRTLVRVAALSLVGKANPGWCSTCDRWTVFVEQGPWLRDEYRCARCDSIPRWRALMYVIERHVPNYTTLTIHESSPGGAGSAKLSASCPRYSASRFVPDAPGGSLVDGMRCENLEALTFPDASFDLF